MDISGGFINKLFFTLSSSNALFIIFVVIICIVFTLVIPQWIRNSPSSEPPALGGSILGNTYQYMTDMHSFLQRVA